VNFLIGDNAVVGRPFNAGIACLFDNNVCLNVQVLRQLKH